MVVKQYSEPHCFKLPGEMTSHLIVYIFMKSMYYPYNLWTSAFLQF